MRYVNWWTGFGAALGVDLLTNHWAAVPGLALAATGVKVYQFGRAYELLGRRRMLEVLPEAEFDPTSDEITRAARLLSSAGADRWAWRGRTIRVRLEGGGALDVRYTMEAPTPALPALRTALGAYRHVELRDAGPLRTPGCTAIRELALAGRPGDALAEAGPGADPLQVFTRVLERLGDDEAGAVALDLLPAPPRAQAALRHRLQRTADRLLEARAETTPARLAEMHRVRGLSERLDPETPLFRLQAFVFGHGSTPARALEVATELEAGFGQWSGRNHWRRVPGPAGWREFRARTALFAPLHRSMATARELASWLRPPTAANMSRRLRRSRGSLGAPPRGLLDYTGAADRLPVGWVETAAGMRPVAVPIADTLFSYVVGRAGSGKTELTLGQALHVALRTTDGLMFIDPHEDAVRRIEAFLAGTPAARRVVRIDLGGLGDRPQMAWNLLSPALAAEGFTADYLRASALRASLAAAMGWTDRHVRVLGLISRASLALAELARRLPDDLQPTVFQLESLLLDEPWREAVLPLLSADQQRYWSTAYAGLPREVASAVLLLADRLRSSPALMALLGQSRRSTYSARRAMDEGQIVLVCTGSGMDGALLANLVLCDLYYAARTRAEIPEAERRPFWVFLDELQTYDAGTGGYVARFVEELRKYGLRLGAANQDPGRLTPRTLGALQTNRSHVFLGASRVEAAAHMVREWPTVSASVVTGLPRRRFVSSVTIGGAPSAPFEINTIRADDLFPTGTPEAGAGLRAEVAERTEARPAEDVVRELEELDTRILAALGVAAEDETPEPIPEGLEPAALARELRYEREMSLRQVSAAMGVSVTQVRRLLGLLDERGYPKQRRLEVLPEADDVAG